MLPTSFLLHCSILIVGLDSFSIGQQRHQNQQRGDYIPNFDYDTENTFKNVEHLIAASSRNGGRRSNNKKSKNSDDDYHVVYESKPESYSNSYHHSDNYREPTKTKSYGSGGGGSGGGGGRRSSYSDNPYRRNENRRSNNNNRNYQEDYDYDDSPRQRQDKGRPEEEYDYDSNGETKHRDRGYDHNEKFDRSTKDDYHKSGDLKEDFDDYGLDSSGSYKRLGGGGGKGRKGKKSYSNADRDIEDSDYVDDAGEGEYSRGKKRSSREREDNPLDKYEKRTRQALKEYGTLDGNAFLGSTQY